MLLIARNKRRVSSRLLSRTLKKANFPADFRSLEEEILQERLKDEYKHYYQIKGEATQLRATALANLAEALAAQGDTKKEKILKALREREQQRSTARKIRSLQGKLRMGSITMVTITDSNGEKVDITDQQEIERVILDSNKQKFSQSAKTPFYLSPLKDEFGFKGLTYAAQATLAGVYDSNHEIDSRILDLIAQWQIPQAVRDLGPLKMELSLDSYIKFLEKGEGRNILLPLCPFLLHDESRCL